MKDSQKLTILASLKIRKGKYQKWTVHKKSLNNLFGHRLLQFVKKIFTLSTDLEQQESENKDCPSTYSD